MGGKAYSYEYDAAGNISKITNPDGDVVEYEYDALNQLVKETYSSCLPLSGEAASANAETQVTLQISDLASGTYASEAERAAEGYYYTAVDYSYDTRGNILSKTYTLTDGTTETINYGYTDPAWKDRLTVYNGVGIWRTAMSRDGCKGGEDHT